MSALARAGLENRARIAKNSLGVENASRVQICQDVPKTSKLRHTVGDWIVRVGVMLPNINFELVLST